MITNFSKYIAAPLTMLALAGCGVSEPEIKKPVRETYVKDNFYNGELNASFLDRTNDPLGRELMIYDEDKDGQADLICGAGLVHWVAPGYTPKRFMTREGDTKTMTPEIQAAANKELQAEKDLAFLLHQENYRLQEQKKGEKQ